MRRPHLAIIGSGPSGLDAALAAADRGWDFTLYEAGPAASTGVRAWGHVPLFTPWSMDVSPRMARHLAAAGHPVPTGNVCPTGKELVDRKAQPGVHRQVTAAVPRRDDDLADEPCPDLAALLVLPALAVLDIGPLRMTGHEAP